MKPEDEIKFRFVEYRTKIIDGKEKRFPVPSLERNRMEKKEFVFKTVVDCKAAITPNDKFDDVEYDCSIELEFSPNEFLEFILEQNAKGVHSHGAYTSLEERGGNLVYKIDFSLGKDV